MAVPGQPSGLRHSNLLRILVLFVLVVLFQVPIFALDALVRDRQQRRDVAVADVASKWGREQTVTGPLLLVPYDQRVERTLPDGKTAMRTEHHAVTLLPERFSVRGRVDAEPRRRGIFTTTVYRAALHIEGSFLAAEFRRLVPAGVEWGRPELLVGVSDVSAIGSAAAIRWNGAPVEALPGADGPGGHTSLVSGIHAEVALPAGDAAIPFAIDLPVKGSAGAYWVPLGKVTDVAVHSNWASPSFQGNWLPERRTVGPHGFEAEWRVSWLGRNFPQAWIDAAVQPRVIESARFGLDLIRTTDHYQMAARSVKYAGLFLLLVFATLWLVEVLARVSVHPIQYLLVGAAMCVFFMLELALSEHLGFGAAYAIATVAAVAQVAAYSVAVLRSVTRAAIVGGMVAVLFGYLYVVLTNEDYALLIGALGVFALLGAIMFLTRRVDWWQPAAQG